MSLDSDHIVDRRRLRRKLTFWRVVAFLIAIVGVVGTAAVMRGSGGTLAQPITPQISRVTIQGIIRGDNERTESLDNLANSRATRAVIVHIDPFQYRPSALAMEVPRDDVGMVLHDREHNFIALSDRHSAEACRDQIDRFGRRAGKDDFRRRPGIEKRANHFARAFVCLGCRIGEKVQPAMDVGIFLFVHMR